MELIGIRECGRRLGVSDTAVHKAIRAGRISAPRDEDRDPNNGRPRLRWPLAETEWRANTDPGMTAVKAPKAKPSPKPARSPDPPAAAVAPEPEPAAAPVAAAPKPATPKPSAVQKRRGPTPGTSKPPGMDDDDDGEAQSSGAALDTYTKARTAREVYQAKLAKLSFEEKMGQLVPAEQVKADAFKVARTVRDAMLNISGRIAHQLAAETDPAVISARIDGEIREALRDLVGAH